MLHPKPQENPGMAESEYYKLQSEASKQPAERARRAQVREGRPEGGEGKGRQVTAALVGWAD